MVGNMARHGKGDAMNTLNINKSHEIDELPTVGIGLSLLLVLFVISRYNFLMFHGLVELFSVAVAWSVFLLVWNTRKITRNDAMLFLGIAYFFIGFIDLTHTLSYKGMGVLPNVLCANYATQLWIAARFIEAGTLILFPFLINRKINTWLVFTSYAAITTFIVSTIFVWEIFPTCYIDGQGLTVFKKYAEYIIVLILSGSINYLFRKRAYLDETVFRLMIGAIVISIAGELAFTFYVSVYGFSNVMGHFFKMISFSLVYIALVNSSLTRPYQTLFRDLEKEKIALQQSEEATNKKIKAILEPAGDISLLSLGDIIDKETLRPLMEEFYKVSNVPTAVGDLLGNALISVGWQDICAKFHRCNPESQKNCNESDTILAKGVPEGEFKAYRCKNNLWDVVTPIFVNGRCLGNIYMGQFLYDDEPIDYELFRRQAQQYGFDEAEYMEALNRVPRLSKEMVTSLMSFWTKFADMIASLSFRNVTLAQTLSQQKATMSELGQQNNYIHTILDTIQDGFWLLNAEGCVIDANAAYCHMSGYSKNELIHMSIGDLDAIETPDTTAARVQRIIKNGSERFETQHRRKDGAVYDVEVSVTWQGGDNQRMICFCNDITQRKCKDVEHQKVQDQLQHSQKMESVGRLAGGVAHDFNNMLSVILGRAEMALEGLDSENAIFTDLEEIKKAGERSAELTSQLLAFARKQTVVPKVLDLNKTVEGMLSMLRRLIGEDVNITWIPGQALWEINMDPSQIDQIMANLCVNARDAINNVGHISIETSTSVFDEDYCLKHDGFITGEFVLLTVKDSGVGMDEETLRHVFEPFFTTKDVGKGTGLGLAMIYGIVQQNNGFIDVCSEVGVGTTFSIYLPRHVGNSGQNNETNKIIEDVTGHETILLVEDEPALLKMTKRMLEVMGYTVVATGDSSEAISLAQQSGEQINLLLTDVIMPEMNGRDLCNKLLASSPNMKHLFMSGYTSNIIEQHGVLDKDVNFLQKPFSKQQLGTKIRNVLDT